MGNPEFNQPSLPSNPSTTLMHSSGQWLRSKIKLPLSKVDAQGVGAAVTYGRRYGLSAMVGIAQYDDDANSIRK